MPRNLPNRQTKVKRNFAYLAMVNSQKIAEFCHMDKTLPNRLREIRETNEMTIEKLAEETGLSVSYISRLESGGRNLSVRNMNLFAHALKVQPHELLSNPQPKSNVVSIMGKIGAGAEISPDDEQVPPEGLYEIETPFPIPDDAIAFEVAGDSMYPRYDEGDVIICYRQGITPNEVIGWEAAVKTADGRRFLKKILRGGTPGTFDLESHNAPPIRNVQLTWIAAVQSVIRIGQWRKLPKSFGRNELAKMS